MSGSEIFSVGSLKVEELAKRVIEELGHKSPAQNRKSVVDTSVWLANITTTSSTYDNSAVMSALLKRGVSRDLLMDCCIPDAARILGDGWMENMRSFGQVSLGAVRLQSLAKSLSLEWGEAPFKAEEDGIFLIVCPDDDHTLGPVILADQLRRKGYSVNIMIGASDEELVKTAGSGNFQLIMFSCSCMVAFEGVKKAAKLLKTKVQDLPPIVLGGPVLEFFNEGEDIDVEVDLITNEVDMALKKASRKKLKHRGIERAS